MDIDLLLKALGNAHRRQLLVWLADPRAHFPPPLPEHADLPGACASYIFEKSPLSQSTTSHYLHMLQQAGLVESDRHGRWTFFRRNEAGIETARKLLNQVLTGDADGDGSDSV